MYNITQRKDAVQTVTKRIYGWMDRWMYVCAIRGVNTHCQWQNRNIDVCSLIPILSSQTPTPFCNRALVAPSRYQYIVWRWIYLCNSWLLLLLKYKVINSKFKVPSFSYFGTFNKIAPHLKRTISFALPFFPILCFRCCSVHALCVYGSAHVCV